jgi:hypothetical protein
MQFRDITKFFNKPQVKYPLLAAATATIGVGLGMSLSLWSISLTAAAFIVAAFTLAGFIAVPIVKYGIDVCFHILNIFKQADDAADKMNTLIVKVDGVLDKAENTTLKELNRNLSDLAETIENVNGGLKTFGTVVRPWTWAWKAAANRGLQIVGTVVRPWTWKATAEEPKKPTPAPTPNSEKEKRRRPLRSAAFKS